MLFSAPFLVCRKDWFWTCHDYSPHLLGYIFQTHLSCWKTNAKTFFSPYPRSSRKPAIIRVKWKHSAEFLHGNGEKWLSHPKTHTFKENSFSPLNQRNATVKELQARFLSYNAVCVRTHIISCWTVSISPNHFFSFWMQWKDKPRNLYKTSKPLCKYASHTNWSMHWEPGVPMMKNSFPVQCFSSPRSKRVLRFCFKEKRVGNHKACKW